MQYSGPGYVVSLPFAELAAQVLGSAEEIQKHSRDIVTAIGVQAVAWAVQDYRDRSERKSAGGIQWPVLTDSAIVTRLAARKPWQTLQGQMEALRKQAEPVLEELRRKLPSNKAKTKSGKTLAASVRGKQRGRIARDFEELDKRLENIRKRRADVRAKKRALVTKEKSEAKIGVDTGRLVNSLVYGVPELADIKPPPMRPGTPNPPRAIWDVAKNSVTIGSNMSYAGYFDLLRPIIGVNFLDAARVAELEDTGREQIQAIVDKQLEAFF